MYQYISIHLYVSIVRSSTYMDVGCGWVYLNSRPKWVWGVGTQWAGIGVRGRVILEPVIFEPVLPLDRCYGMSGEHTLAVRADYRWYRKGKGRGLY
jgi:hypothetical protein